MKMIHLIILFLLMVFIVIALQVTTFQDGTSAKNLTFIGAGSQYVNLSLPNNANVSSTTAKLKGYASIGNVVYINESPDSYAFVGSFGAGGDYYANKSIDGNWSSRAAAGIGTVAYVYENYTINVNYTYLNLTVSGYTYQHNFIVNYWNYTSSNWSILLSEDFGDFVSANRTITLPEDGKNGKLQTRVDLYCCGSRDDYYEGQLLYLKSNYPTNLTIKNNNILIYQNPSEFNGSSTIDLNTSVLNNCTAECLQPEGGNCICTLNLTSATAGILQLSNLNISYSISQAILFSNSSDITGSYFTTDTISRGITINSTYLQNQTNCDINVSVDSLRAVMSVNETNFTIQNKSTKDITVSFVNPPAVDYTASNAYFYAYCENNRTQNIYLRFVVSSPSSSGGGGGISPSAECSIDLYRPKAGSNIIMYAGKNSNTKFTEFQIRNSGNKSGTFHFDVIENDYLNKNCVFNASTMTIQPSIVESNFISCKVADELQEGTLLISGCGQEQAYKLYVAENKFKAFMSGILTGESNIIIGSIAINPLFFLFGCIVFLFVVFPIIIYMIKTLFF